jgi:hypothetical protein
LPHYCWWLGVTLARRNKRCRVTLADEVAASVFISYAFSCAFVLFGLHVSWCDESRVSIESRESRTNRTLSRGVLWSEIVLFQINCRSCRAWKSACFHKGFQCLGYSWR